MSDIGDKSNVISDLLFEAALSRTKQLTANDIKECIDCGDVIDQARKCAVPWAMRCVDCQNDFENEKRTR